MRKSLRLLIAVVALGVVCVCVAAGAARQRVGGYKEVAADDPEVAAAAKFAVGEQGRKQDAAIKLISVERAESQVVAGINYRLCLKVEVGDEAQDVDVTQEVKAVVYRNLKKEYSLTTWEAAECGESE
jgi:cystatin-C